MSEIKKGISLTFILMFLTNITGILLTPFIISNLGNSEYGLYSLFGALVATISIFDFGLNNAVIRFVAKYKAENNKEKEELFLGHIILLYILVTVVISVVGFFVYNNLDDMFSNSLTQSELSKGKDIFLILVFNLAITLPGGVFSGICRGYEKYIIPQIVNILRILIRAILILVLLKFGGDALAIVILDTVLNITIMSILAYYSLFKLKVRFSFNKLNLAFVKKIGRYSFWIFIFAITSQIQWEIGKVFVGTELDTSAVAVYAVGIMLGTYYSGFGAAISSVFLPKATQLVVADADVKKLTSVMITMGRIILLVLLFLLGGFIHLGESFINLWLGEAYQNSWRIALIIMVVFTISLTQAFGHSILEAKNKVYFKAIINLVLIVPGAFSGILLMEYLGSFGMVLGATIGWLASIIFLNVYYHKVINLNMLRFYKELLSKIFISFMLILLLTCSLRFTPNTTWVWFVLNGFIYSFVYIFVMYFFGMNYQEKELVTKVLGKLNRENKI